MRLKIAGETAETPGGIAILRKGFRPFFAVAGVYAVLIVPLWILVRAGVVPGSGWVEPAQWHAHEMLYGYAAAVIAGFLLTAASNWTKRTTAIGAGLFALVALWIAGRVCTAVPGLPPALVFAVDAAFFPALAIAIGRPIVAAGSRRNYVFLVLISLLCGACVMVHLEPLGVLEDGARRGHLLAVDLVTMVILVVAGRIIPAFTRNATKASGIESSPIFDRLTLVGMGAVVVADAALPDFAPTAILAGVVGLVAAARMKSWGTKHTSSEPLLWVLHLGYAWVPIGLVLRAASSLTTFVPSAAALHALTAGAIGTLTLGMMARVSLGHTGRPLRAGRALTGAFVLISLAASVRVVGTFLGYGAYRRALEISATCWSLAFCIYVVTVVPVLFRARPDGKGG